MLHSRCPSLDNETRSNEGCESSGQSASFHCVLRSDDEARRVLEALQNREKKVLSNEELNASDSEGSICSVESVCSAAGVCDSERLPFNGSCISLNCNPGNGGGPYSVTSKREHFSTGPLSVTPSRKRKKNEGHFDPTLGSTDDISPSNTTSNPSQGPKTCVPTTRSAAATSNRSTTTTNSSNSSGNSSSSSRSTGYAFTPQQDEKILSAVEYFTRNGLQLNNVWRSLSSFVKTTDESVKERWMQLDTKKRAAQKVKVPEETNKHTRDRKRASNGTGLSVLPADNLSTGCSKTRSGASGVSRPHRKRSVTNGTAKSGTICAATSSSAREETILYMNIERYTHAEDQHILDFVAKQEQDGVCMQETWNILSHALSRRADCVRARWLKLSSNTSLNIQETTSSLATNVFDSASATSYQTSNSWDFINTLARSDTSILADFNWSEATTQALDNEHILAADVHADSCEPNSTVADSAEINSIARTSSTLNTADNIFVSTSTPIMQAFLSIFGTSHSKGIDNSMESATGNACTHHSNTNDDNNSIVQVCNEVPPSPAQHISPAADSIDLAQSPLQSDSSVDLSISVGSVSSNGLFVTYYGLDNDDSNYW